MGVRLLSDRVQGARRPRSARLWEGPALRLLIALLLGFSISSAALGETLKGVTLSDSLVVGGTILVLNGMGARDELGIVGHVAGLYLPGREAEPAVILSRDTLRVIIMQAKLKLQGRALCKQWRKKARSNNGGLPPEVEGAFETLCRSMPSRIRKREQIILSYVPGYGTELLVAGESKGRIPGKGFAQALFSVWLGPKPIDRQLKRGLLGA